MKKTINRIEYDTDECVAIVSSETTYCVKYNGYNFDYAILCITSKGNFFLHGKGPLGCNSIVPMSMISAANWIKEAMDNESPALSEKVLNFLEEMLHSKPLKDVQIVNVLGSL